ncbi:MAG: energy transducer TonB [Bacteroidetes bacterium]|nr:MAG: energy transducer TonB [Bacteroidota bacterium]
MRNAHPHTAKIRRRRIIYFELGLILALSSMLWAFNLNFEPGIDLRPTESDPFDKEFDSLIIVNIEEEIMKQEALKSQPAPIPEDLFKQVDDETPIPTLKDKPVETLTTSDLIDLANNGLFDEITPTEEIDPIILVPGVSPQFPGGEAAMMLYIRKNIKYPPLAKENNIQGQVVISFVVEKDGSLSNIKIEKAPPYGLGEEAKRVIESMPRWTPGEQNFHPVRVRMNIPIKFRLD